MNIYEDRNEREKVYRKALITFGAFHQLAKAVEELSEAQKEICRTLQGEVDMEHLAEEVADAVIVLEQVRQIMPIDRMVNDYMVAKVERLNETTKKRREQQNREAISLDDVSRIFSAVLPKANGND